MYTSLNRSRSAVLCSTLFLLLIGACGSDGITSTTFGKGDQLSVVPADPVLRTGETLQFSISGPGASGGASTIWSVGNPATARITPGGLLTALASGQVIVRADKSGNSAFTVATVSESLPRCPSVTIGFHAC